MMESYIRTLNEMIQNSLLPRDRECPAVLREHLEIFSS